MWEILENYLLIKALNTCPKSNKSPNLVTLIKIPLSLAGRQSSINVFLLCRNLPIDFISSALALFLSEKRLLKSRSTSVLKLPQHR